jgi:hypothetical protein
MQVTGSNPGRDDPNANGMVCSHRPAPPSENEHHRLADLFSLCSLPPPKYCGIVLRAVKQAGSMLDFARAKEALRATARVTYSTNSR